MIDLNNDDQLMFYAIKAYDSPNCVMSEFEEDMKRFKYIKRLIKKYKLTGKAKTRLILNHIIILGNVFGVEPTVRMLFYKTEQDDWPILKTFLLFLNYMPRVVRCIRGTDIHSADVTVDVFLAKSLRDI